MSQDMFDANTPDHNSNQDPIFIAEQEHLTQTYNKLVELRDALSSELETAHEGAAKDLRDLSDEIRVDFGGADETMETLAAIETLNAVIDAYNQYHDFSVDKLRRILLALQRPYFAMVRLQMRPNRPARDIYIGAAGVTDDARRPFIVDWRSPVAETYYNQQMGETSYLVDGKERKVVLELRRQYDISRNILHNYFDTTVAIQDSMLLNSLKRHHSEKLQAITATIQREQNQIVRHEDVPALLVDGIAGSGKTSVLLQRIAYLFYQERETLRPDQVYLFTPNSVFESYIDQVLPSLGESNPQVFTWKSFMSKLGLSERNSGASDSPESLKALELALKDLHFQNEDFKEIRMHDTVLLKPQQIASALAKFSQFPPSPKLIALTKDELHERLNRRMGQLAKNEDLQEEMLSLTLEEQVELFGESLNPVNDEETQAYAKRYVDLLFSDAHEEVEQANWLRFDRIGMRMLKTDHLTAAEWLYLKMLITGANARDARFVLIDEVQDYTATQLIVLARYFKRAHFMLLGDKHQAIFEGTASFDELKAIFTQSHGSIEDIKLTTSYRSSPEITQLFASLLDPDEQRTLSSVHRPGIEPQIMAIENTNEYVTRLRKAVAQAHERDGLTAVICAHKDRASWMAKQLGDSVLRIHDNEPLPKEGVILIDLALAKGLEFDEVIIPDAQATEYDNSDLSRRRLYTAISRAMHQVTILAQGELSPALTCALATNR
ncbi:HelD family protein [Atopobium fossor]|uniref:HelD family protein n=1 Tax=Atopobium fossor TaxID=39487 RepID=UPI0003F8CF75|nr:UvrD-helicase domain-containing protein [Atopobium fossor]